MTQSLVVRLFESRGINPETSLLTICESATVGTPYNPSTQQRCVLEIALAALEVSAATLPSRRCSPFASSMSRRPSPLP